MMKRRPLLILAILVWVSMLACSQARYAPPAQAPGAYSERGPAAKSLILFIGDGMGPEILSIAKIYSDKALGKALNMTTLSVTGTMGMASTYSANKLVTDSAAGATALATGVKTNNGVVGESPDGQILANLLEIAWRSGKSVGVITTTTVTDATPASFLAHAPARAAEFDIAAQIVEANATVVMGGGRAYFRAVDGGKRPDGRDLIAEAKTRGFDIAFDKDGLSAATGKRLLGLFADEDLPFQAERVAYETPSLSEMLRKALQMLTGDPDGFVLVIEGGRIDHAEHENNLAAALGEFFELDAAIGEAMQYQESDSTLAIVVTADHDTGGPGITSTERGYPGVDTITNLLSQDFTFVKWVSEGHSSTMVPIVARGPGEGAFEGIKDNTDINRGMVNILGLRTEMGQ